MGLQCRIQASARDPASISKRQAWLTTNHWYSTVIHSDRVNSGSITLTGADKWPSPSVFEESIATSRQNCALHSKCRIISRRRRLGYKIRNSPHGKLASVTSSCRVYFTVSKLRWHRHYVVWNVYCSLSVTQTRRCSCGTDLSAISLYLCLTWITHRTMPIPQTHRTTIRKLIWRLWHYIKLYPYDCKQNRHTCMQWRISDFRRGGVIYLSSLRTLYFPVEVGPLKST